MLMFYIMKNALLRFDMIFYNTLPIMVYRYIQFQLCRIDHHGDVEDILRLYDQIYNSCKVLQSLQFQLSIVNFDIL